MRSALFTDESKAKKLVALKHKEGKKAEIKKEVWLRNGIKRTEYRVNYEA